MIVILFLSPDPAGGAYASGPQKNQVGGLTHQSLTPSTRPLTHKCKNELKLRFTHIFNSIQFIQSIQINFVYVAQNQNHIDHINCITGTGIVI